MNGRIPGDGIQRRARSAVHRCMSAGVLATLALTGCGPGVEAPGRAAAPPFEFTAAQRAAAVAASDPDALLDALSRIQGWHAYRRTGVWPALQAGVPLAELDALEAELGCRWPEELRALWRWRDGHAAFPDARWFVWYHRLLPVREAVAEYRALRADATLGWNAAWFPVLEFDEEWYFVECTAERAAASPVGFMFVENGAQPAYVNLTTLFVTASEAMAAGAVTWDDADIDADVGALAALHARHNPGFAFPYAVPAANDADR